ncbi:hypothetical protein O3Q52_03115 [Streptomyces sp. ActVer]|uniref:hypothetical protein n=1 Tax=Streptomyces sp. ActVer TaxID=3014558 RepID=UPI0022B4401D|nr:hypothetical protein [Streptomyces sp. ActVer]MCZ4507211.1 hypothetical protein [Streptomyces sp. ActVer]
MGGISNTNAFDLVLSVDWLFTSLARQLRVRKALIQAPVLWELRKFNPLDVVADTAVKTGVDDDCSTGWAQIFAWVAIDARNHCVEQGIINGSILDAPRDKPSVWTQLNEGPDLQHQVGCLPDDLQRPPDQPAEAGAEHERG